MLSDLIEAYKAGTPWLGWQNLLRALHLKLDEVPLPQPLLNYGHALLYGDFLDAIHTGRHLWQYLPNGFTGSAKEALQEELALVQLACLKGEPLQRYVENGSVQGALGDQTWITHKDRYHWLLEEKLLFQTPNPTNTLDPWVALVDEWGRNCARFRQQQPALWDLCQKHEIHFSRPFYPLRIRPESTVRIDHLFHMEPYQLDWESLIPQLPQPSAFIFRKPSLLLQALQFPVVAEALIGRKHLIYLLPLYPNPQLRLQPLARRLRDPLKNTFLGPLLKQDRATLAGDSEVADKVYQTLKGKLQDQELREYGPSRILALRARWHQRDWHDPHKGRPVEAEENEERREAILHNFLEGHTPPQRRPSHARGKLHITHVVPQVVTGGHAPSKLLKTFMQHHDRQQFDLSLFVTERLRLHLAEYPYPTHFSPSSLERGSDCLKAIQDQGVSVFVDDARLSYEETAKRIADGIQQLKSDIVIFHGPDEINLLTAQLCDAPCKVFFEHGTLPKQSTFDLVIASTTDSARNFRDYYKSKGAEIHGIPFVLDLRSQWEEHPTPKALLGVPENARIMTTISNHLEARLSPDMLWAIKEILRKVPEAYYCPIGSVKNPEKVRQTFVKEGLDHRVIFLGTQENPSQLARSMDLYLNEFPFGSCIGMLDAMAAGCPPISMYDPKGPPQARYGGDYFGIERTITSLRKEDYAELAIELLTDSATYQKWSQHALRVYEARANAQEYVRTVETALLKNLSTQSPHEATSATNPQHL